MFNYLSNQTTNDHKRHGCIQIRKYFSNGDVESKYQRGFTWKKGKLRKAKLGIEMNVNDSNIEYFDGYSNKRYTGKKKVTQISTGFHAAKSKTRLLKVTFGGDIIKEFLIPKGSLIFTDATGLIVSNRMKML